MSQQQRDHHNLMHSHTKDYDDNSTNTVNQNQKALTKQALTGTTVWMKVKWNLAHTKLFQAGTPHLTVGLRLR